MIEFITTHKLASMGIFIWILGGLLAWTACYYSIIKTWYFQFNEDLRKWHGSKNALTLLKMGLIVFLGVGPIMFLVMLPDILKRKTPFDRGITLYFKIPKNVNRTKDSRDN